MADRYPPAQPGQLYPGRRPAGEKASYPCPRKDCLTVTQGGKAGLLAHLRVVHPERDR